MTKPADINFLPVITSASAFMAVMGRLQEQKSTDVNFLPVITSASAFLVVMGRLQEQKSTAPELVAVGS